ncbi:recombinase family protein [Rhodococcus indonesiensis]|uniref:recombinase family protein n=1 Tax=Rhodococcus indonesiensis TaxID=3055869 RepID=UPI0039F735B6
MELVRRECNSIRMADVLDLRRSGSDTRPVCGTARPHALKLLDALRARLDSRTKRRCNSLLHIAGVMEQAQGQGWSLVVCDSDIDMSTPSGEMFAHIVAASAHYERRLISTRTRDALAVKRAQGVRLGRSSVLPQVVVARIVAERAAGRGLRVIAEGLTADGIPTARGRTAWSTSWVQAVLAGQDAAAVRAE